MIETDDIFEVAKRQFFIDKFVPALEDWKRKNKGKGGTQEAFARMIDVHKNMIGQYKTGDAYPREDTLKAIIKVLGVDDDYFTLKTETEFYKYSPKYMTDIGENKILPYCEEIGLDPKFLSAISDIIGESLGDHFPFWTPIILNPHLFCDLENKYIRPDPVKYWSNSAEMEESVKMFQIEVTKKQGDSEIKKKITLTPPDLRFLKDVQEEVKDFVGYLFLKRKKELKEESEEASRRAYVPVSGGGWMLKMLKAEDRNSIDKYFKDYVDREAASGEERRTEDGDN